MLKKQTDNLLTIAVALFALQGCGEGVIVDPVPGSGSALDVALTDAISVASNGRGNQWLILPESDDFSAIPQDPANPVNSDKVALGKILFHDTAIATNGQSNQSKMWSCASCHHAAAGFKSGIPQGLGEGGTGFGSDGSERRLALSFDAYADKDAPNKPDLQPLTSPSILNTAYQDVMLWNGQFGNRDGGVVNAGIAADLLTTPDTPKKENGRRLSGLETQAIAGLDVHRLGLDELTMQTYNELFRALDPSCECDKKVVAGKAIAAYERTVLANRAPFQHWLKGDSNALSDTEKRGATLFFGKAGCSDCHRGPALSSELNASEDDMFMAIGFADFDSTKQPLVHGPIAQADKLGRGGFTKEPSDNFKFKIPQLYNLRDTNVLGHGASFSTIREVLEYKNRAVVQNADSAVNQDERFTPLNLSNNELDELTAFLSNGLYDPELGRYQPTSVPSGECIIVEPQTINTHGMCPD